MHASPHVRAAAWGAALLLTIIAGFQLYWGLGGTWGLDEASGGTLVPMSTAEQIASVVVALMFLACAGTVLVRAGYESDRVPSRIVRVGTWVIVGAFAFGTLANFSARTDFERFVNGPVALVIAALTFVVARSHVAPSRAPGARTRGSGSPRPVH